MISRRALGPGVCLVLLVTATGCGSRRRGEPAWDVPWSGDPGTPRAEIVVDFTRVENRRVPVTMRVTGLEGNNIRFRHNGKGGEYKIHDVRFEDGMGTPLESRVDGWVHIPERFEGDVIQASWLAEPGEMGRHGLQGTIAHDWSTFEGRIYLIPRGDKKLQAARIQFITPEGWSVASPFRRDGEWHYLDIFDPEDTSELLENACLGVGRFDIRTRRYGEMEARVAAYSTWSEEYKSKVFDSTFGIIGYFHESLGFDLHAPYSVVWSPKYRRYRVHGGASATGTCLEQPDGELRKYQLLAHRIAHSMDKYRPSGFRIREASHMWFREGWPSYMEVIATAAAGVAEDEGYFNRLYSDYKMARRDNIESDIPLAEEKSAAGHVTEFLHYKKGPLVTRMLADQIEMRSGRTLLEFMREAWAEYGFYRKPFDVKQELEAFTGSSFDDFWEMMVIPRGTVIPVWEEYLTDGIRARLDRPPAAHVGGQPISGDYLHHLAWTGDFASFAQIREFLIAEEIRRRQLAARGIVLYPERLRRHLYALPGDDRYAVARYEASYPLDPAGPKTAGGDVRLEVDRQHWDGRAFAELLEIERAYAADVSGRSGEGFEVRTKSDKRLGVARLGFGADAVLELLPDWRPTSRRAEVELLVNGQRSGSWTVDYRDRSTLLLTAGDRPKVHGTVAFRVRLDGGAPLTRAYWQRGKEPAGGGVISSGILSDRIVLEDPDDPEAWYKNGIQLSARGNHTSALSSLHQAVRMDPEDPKKWFKYGESLAALDRHADAVEAFDHALERSPSHLAAAGHKALSLARMERRDETLKALDYLMENCDVPERFYWKGKVLDHLGDVARAAEAYREFTVVSPRRADGWRGLGHALLRLEQYREAVEAFDRALELDPKDAQAQRERRLAQRALDRPRS